MTKEELSRAAQPLADKSFTVVGGGDADYILALVKMMAFNIHTIHTYLHTCMNACTTPPPHTTTTHTHTRTLMHARMHTGDLLEVVLQLFHLLVLLLVLL